MTCTLFSLVLRGTRYPTADNVADIEALLATLQRFPDLIPLWLRNYSLPYNASVAGELSAAGEQEMHDLGHRMVRATGHLEPVTFNQNKSHVRHTYASRTKASARAYVPLCAVAADCDSCCGMRESAS